MNIFIFKIILVKMFVDSKNLLHPKKDLIFALNFGVHKGNLRTPCSGHI